MNKMTSFSACLALLALTHTAQAQISGRVTDISGQGIAGVALTCSVTCTDPFGTHRTFSDSRMTDTDGQYALPGCLPIPGGSTCQQRSDSFSISKPGYVFVKHCAPGCSGDYIGT